MTVNLKLDHEAWGLPVTSATRCEEVWCETQYLDVDIGQKFII